MWKLLKGFIAVIQSIHFGKITEYLCPNEGICDQKLLELSQNRRTTGGKPTVVLKYDTEYKGHPWATAVYSEADLVTLYSNSGFKPKPPITDPTDHDKVGQLIQGAHRLLKRKESALRQFEVAVEAFTKRMSKSGFDVSNKPIDRYYVDPSGREIPANSSN